MLAQNGLAQEDHELIRPKDAAFAIDDADAIAVAVEGNTEIAALAGHGGAQLLKVARHGRIGVVSGKAAVDFRVQQDVASRNEFRYRADDFSRSAVAAVPRYGKIGAARQLLGKCLGIIAAKIAVGEGPDALHEISGRRNLAKRTNASTM